MVQARKSTSVRLRLALLMGTTALASPAFAQEISPTPPTEEAPAQEILVTGSRIPRPDLTSNSPIVVVSEDALKTTNAVTLDDTLNRLPQITPAFGAGNNNAATGGVTTVSLRGLEAPRTLVLLDGRRLNSATASGAVDVNIIPTALIETIEVVTGGASAAYGSDAVAGVVNFRLKRNFDGVALESQNGITERGDGFTSKTSLTLGTDLAERGNVVLSLSYDKREGVNGRSRAFSAISRPSSSLPFGTFVPNATNLPTAAAINTVFAGYGVTAGAPTTGDIGFNNNATLFGPNSGVNFLGGASDILRVGSAVRFNSSGVNGLVIPYERYGAFAKGEYEIGSEIKAFGQAGFQNVTSATVFAPGFTTVTVPSTNPFIPADLRQILNSRPTPGASFTVNRRFADVGPRTARSETNSYYLVAGLEGRIAPLEGTWNVYASRGHSEVTQRDRNGFSLSALGSLVNAADGGASQCAGGFNLFGNQANTACAAFITRNTLRNTVTNQDLVEATVQGKIFSWWAGDVRFAVGADHRSNSYDFTPDSALAAGDVVSFATGRIPPVNGTVKVSEFYGELLVPLLKDLPAIQELSVNLGYRYSDYNNFGGVDSYRAEGEWRVIDALRIRGGYARAVRAPSVFELFSPQTPSAPLIGAAGGVGQGDPCDINSAYRQGTNATQVRSLCLAQGVPANIIDTYTFTNTQITDGGLTGGNPNLKPEVADTYTVGAVVTPTFNSSVLSRVSLSVDYYNIRVRQAISTIPGASIVQRCFNLGGFNPSYVVGNEYCSYFGRSASTGQINRISLFNLNLGEISTAGIDVSLAARISLGDGELNLNGSVNWVDKYAVAIFPGSAPVDLSGSIGNTAGDSSGKNAAYPKWKGLANISYENGGARIGVQYRYIDKMIDSSAIGVANSNAIGVPSYSYFDINGQYEVNERLTVRMGVVNVGDKQPPVYTSFQESNTYPGLYDLLGRSYYFGAAIKF